MELIIQPEGNGPTLQTCISLAKVLSLCMSKVFKALIDLLLKVPSRSVLCHFPWKSIGGGQKTISLETMYPWMIGLVLSNNERGRPNYKMEVTKTNSFNRHSYGSKVSSLGPVKSQSQLLNSSSATCRPMRSCRIVTLCVVVVLDLSCLQQGWSCYSVFWWAVFGFCQTILLAVSLQQF